MNIAIDTQALFSPRYKGRGIANYVLNQLRQLLQLDTQNQYIFFNIYDERPVLETFFAENNNTNIKEFHLYTGREQFLLLPEQQESDAPEERTGEWRYEKLVYNLVRNFLGEYEIDCFFLASPFDHWDIFTPEMFAGVRTVATIYDIVPHLMPDTYLRYESVKKTYYKTVDLLRGFDKLLAISQSAKDDLVNHLGFEESRVDVIYAGIDPSFSEKQTQPGEQQRICDKFGITGEFIFCAGGSDVRKNMEEMAEAYCRLPQHLRQQYQFVVVCKLYPHYRFLLDTIAEKYAIDKQRFVYTDFVTQDELVELYRMAHLTIFASQYEGFGLPVIESMMCGTPVVTSNNSSLGEIAAGAAVLVDPYNKDSIAEGLRLALEGGMGQYTEAMQERTRKFTWENSGRLTHDALCGIVPPEKRLQPLPQKKKPIRNLAVFAPLPPLAVDIAGYCVALLNELRQHVNRIDVYIETGYTATLPEWDNVKVYSCTEYPAHHNEYDETLFEISDNIRHHYMLGYLHEYGGVADLHDVNLHSWLYTALLEERQDFAGYQNLLALDQPRFAQAITEKLQIGSLHKADVLRVCTNGFVTQYAAKCFVHSQTARKELLRVNIRRDSLVLPAYMPQGQHEQQCGYARTVLGLPEEAVVFTVFCNSVDEVVVRAFSMLLAGGTDAYLCVVNTSGATVLPAMQMLVDSFGLGQRVRLAAYPSEEGILCKIACDIGVNLCTTEDRGINELSNAVLAAGKPVIVADVGANAELPDACCYKVTAVESVVKEWNVFAAMRHMVDNEDGRLKKGEQAQLFAGRCCTMQQVVEKLLENLVCENTTNEVLEENLLAHIAKAQVKEGQTLPVMWEGLSETLVFTNLAQY